MPAKRRRIAKKENTLVKKKFNIKLLLTLVFLIFLLILFSLHKNHWDKHNRLVLAIHKDNGDVLVSSIDPVAKKIVNINIPGTTEVEVDGGLGIWKLESVWKLGLQEGRGGQLFTKTITKNFTFPVVAWGGEEYLFLESGKLIDSLKTFFPPSKSNLSIGDRVSLSIFALTLDGISKDNIDFSQTRLLKQKDLQDGSVGYVLTGQESSKIRSYFSDYYMTQSLTKVSISGGTNYESETVAKVIETMGGKVLSIEKDGVGDNEGCTVSPPTDKRAIKISAVLSCKLIELPEDSGYDVSIKLSN